MNLKQRAEAFKAEWKSELIRRQAPVVAVEGVPDVADLLPLLQTVAKAEREACAKIADMEANGEGAAAAQKIARRIREME